MTFKVLLQVFFCHLNSLLFPQLPFFVVFSSVDSYGFRRGEEFDYEYYKSFISAYNVTLNRRSGRWSGVLKNGAIKQVPKSSRSTLWFSFYFLFTAPFVWVVLIMLVNTCLHPAVGMYTLGCLDKVLG